MKVLNLVWKWTIVLTSLVSLVALAESYYDQKFYSVSFVQDQDFQLTIDENSDYKRNVASQKKLKQLPAVKIIQMDQKDLINGQWEIVRYLDEKGVPGYDKINNEEDKNGFVSSKFELIGLSTVKVDDDLTFKVSTFNNEGPIVTITLFKPFNDSYEIIEARKITEHENAIAFEQVEETVVEEPQKEEKKDPVDKFSIEGELFLTSALDVKKSRSVLRGESQLRGSASLDGGVLTIDYATLHLGTKNENGIDGLTLTLGDNGQFGEYGEDVTGIVSVLNGNEIKVTFSSGPLQNAILNFVTEDRKEQLDEQRREMEERRAEREAQERENNIEQVEGSREVANAYQNRSHFKQAAFNFNAEENAAAEAAEAAEQN
ncbi:MAG: hypothetical protein GY909_11400 [Oligoflexia bacterium]|nr:hypothetical protein [Oligoflexia bacterium]